ncbi:MAG: hypothetical protein J6Y78_15445 [Paludibacteraceae bacterium]|nr:hypothetical protein [Paludibacteraceae bacterium]
MKGRTPITNKTELTELTSKVAIPKLYENIAVKLGIKNATNFDCTKVLVGQSIFDACSDFYKEHGVPDDEFAMLWVCYGPKASLEGYKVEVEDSWCTSMPT